MKGMKHGFLIALVVAIALPLAALKMQACGGVDPTPAPVEGLKAVAGDGQVFVAWNLSKNAASYNLYWDTQSGVTKARMDLRKGTKVENLKSTAYFHASLTNGMTYYYIATAVSEGGKESLPPTSEVSATPHSAINCPATQILCQDKCVSIQTDPANCGACQKACGMGEICVAGACQ